MGVKNKYGYQVKAYCVCMKDVLRFVKCLFYIQHYTAFQFRAPTASVLPYALSFMTSSAIVGL
jgi:hypothetical protein